MRRRSVEDLCSAGFQRRHINAGAVERQITAFNAVAGIDLGDLAVARILHGEDLVAPQQLDQQAIEVFRPSADDDLLW